MHNEAEDPQLEEQGALCCSASVAMQTSIILQQYLCKWGYRIASATPTAQCKPNAQQIVDDKDRESGASWYP